MSLRLALSTLLLAAAPTAVMAQAMPDGFLCCNMRTDGKWISDINYVAPGKYVLPAGTPIKVTGYGRHRVMTQIEGQPQILGNDYSRDLQLDTFAQRYVVAANPQTKISTFPPRVREAIKSSRLFVGMTREQVLMSVGYPVTSENPRLEANIWRYWLNMNEEFQVVFDAQGLVKEIGALPLARSQIVME
ncbi:MAG TPA: outer membrane protein assembly factor BamE [Polaromonas sp.]|uniref:outer membrane protein assembly factor BamE domain-containing protein n=1 Tax=Polaromonas sp. TaxID=1869339 RepID=UPI002D747CA2|nr:outer membrane protein assembly factor BamE [Polaromonas sp.]HYW58411.1 outer membrane protein assembly factor BamE [Polaromonas sp.]